MSHLKFFLSRENNSKADYSVLLHLEKMAGSYGWKIESTEEFIGNEGEYNKITMPFGTEEATRECQNSNPYVKALQWRKSSTKFPFFLTPECIRALSPKRTSHEVMCELALTGSTAGLFLPRTCRVIPIASAALALPNESVENQPPGMWRKGYYWCASSGEIPAQAVKSGIDKDGGDIYVGRAIHEGELQPAKIVPNHGCAYIAYNGEEVRKEEYEILCRGDATVIWQECQHGVVPSNAVPVGCTADNERLFIGRVFHDGTHTPGKIQPSHGACYIPYGGEELCFPNYEVLILQ